MSDERFPSDSFPRQNARTRHFSLGRPRTFNVADDGSRIAFLRSRAGDDPLGCLWVFDVDEANACANVSAVSSAAVSGSSVRRAKYRSRSSAWRRYSSVNASGFSRDARSSSLSVRSVLTASLSSGCRRGGSGRSARTMPRTQGL